MTEYPKYIIDESERRMTVAANGFPVTFNRDMHAHRVIADLLIESGFKTAVDPLLGDVWFCAAYADRNEEDFDGFKSRLLEKGLTVTVTKAGEAWLI